MKKLMLLVPVAALAMASCSSEDVVQQKATSTAQELTIRPVVQGATRSLITDATLAKFYVEAEITSTAGEFWAVATNATEAPTAATATATKTKLPYEVSKNAAGKWEVMDNKKWYWSSKNASAKFTAVYPKEAWKDENGDVVANFSIDNEISKQNDVIVAYNEGVASTFDNGVPMLFRHVLSQIVIKADNKDADVRQIKVAGVRLHNIANTNKLTLPNSKTTAEDFSWESYTPWTAAPTNLTNYTYYKKALESGTVAADGAVTLNAGAQEITFDGPALLFPQTRAAATDLSTDAAGNLVYFDVLVQVQNKEASATTDAAQAVFPKIGVSETIADQKFAWVAVPVAIAWNPGYKYTYVLHFSKDGIGKISPDTGEGGVTDPDPGKDPGTDIVDNPVPLYFTVTIDEWQDAANTEKDL